MKMMYHNLYLIATHFSFKIYFFLRTNRFRFDLKRCHKKKLRISEAFFELAISREVLSKNNRYSGCFYL